MSNDDEIVDDPVEVPIDGTIDLHTFDPRDVKVLVPDYLAGCRERGIYEVRIIHGKGRGVLRDTVHALLARAPGVVDFRLAGLEPGGWGATIVTLAPPGADATAASAGEAEEGSQMGHKDAGGGSIGESLSWPAGLHPDETPVYTLNALDIPAPAEHVWAWLIRAARWPEWYGNCGNVRFLSGAAPDLAAGTEWGWTTFGVPVRTTVTEFEPPARLAWLGGALGAQGYHGWLIERTGAGCRVVTEETQRGFVPSIARWYLRRGLLREHQNWLEGLSRMARSGSPG